MVDNWILLGIMVMGLSAFFIIAVWLLEKFWPVTDEDVQ